MTNATICKSTWAAVAVPVLFTIFLGLAPQVNAAEATRLTKKEVKTLIATAKTPEDHVRLARYYRAEADRLEAEAKDHDQMGQEYRRNPVALAGKTPMHPRSAEHCEYLAKSLREAAKSARELAAEHEEMAKNAAK